MSSINWLPLESNPEVMNKCLKSFGVPEKWGISDIISLDEEFIDMIPTPSLALLLLFPTTPKYLEYCEQLEELHKHKDKNVEGVYYMKQTIRNACGTVALLHAIANNERKLNLESGTVIKKFLDSTKDLSPEEKGKLLEENVDISAVHESSAQQGQTEAPNLDEDVNLHFIAVVNVNGKLVELAMISNELRCSIADLHFVDDKHSATDCETMTSLMDLATYRFSYGRKFGPLVHGTTSEETFLKDALRVCKGYIERDPDNLHFNALTFGALHSQENW